MKSTFSIATKQRHIPWLHFYLQATVNNFGYVTLTFSLMVPVICRRIFTAAFFVLWIDVGFAVVVPERIENDIIFLIVGT